MKPKHLEPYLPTEEEIYTKAAEIRKNRVMKGASQKKYIHGIREYHVVNSIKYPSSIQRIDNVS
jgi:hypothetical protein